MNDDLISREETLTAFADYVGSGMSMNDYDALWNIVSKIPPVTKWVPIVSREMTEDEAKNYFDYLGDRIGEAYTILDCYLPEDGQEVLITVNGYVTTDTFVRDEGYGCYFEGYDIEDVTAWQPLPEPYKKGDTE